MFQCIFSFSFCVINFLFAFNYLSVFIDFVFDKFFKLYDVSDVRVDQGDFVLDAFSILNEESDLILDKDDLVLDMYIILDDESDLGLEKEIFLIYILWF